MAASRTLDALLATAFAGAAAFHAAALLWPDLGEPAPPWSHALFVGINLALARGLLRRPRGLTLLFALFTLERKCHPQPVLTA